MSAASDDPRCPECGEPIGSTATYCMHCSADLTAARDRADADGDGYWDERRSAGPASATGSATSDDGGLLDPDGLVDNTLTIVVGIVAGFVVGLVATVALAFITGSGLAFLGIVVWLGATAVLVRQRTVQGAVSKAAYAVAAVLLLVPLIPLSPVVDAAPGSRGVGFVVLLVVVGVPALVAAAVGYVAGRFVPEEGTGVSTDG